MSPGQEMALKKVETFRKEHPESTLAAAFKATKTNPSQYYNAKGRGKVKRRKIVKPLTIAIADQPAAKVTALIGDPLTISRMLHL
jgi:hypothetical protein